MLLPDDPFKHDFIPFDFSECASIDGLIVSEFARKVLSPLLDSCGQFWPVEVVGHRYWWFECSPFADVIDYGETRVSGEQAFLKGKRFYLGRVQQLGFDASSVRAAPSLFRIAELPFTLFAKGEVVAGIRRHDLTGTWLTQVWSELGVRVYDDRDVFMSGIGDQSAKAWAARKRAKRAAAREILRRRVAEVGGSGSSSDEAGAG